VNYKAVLFDYKNFQPVPELNLKRRNENPHPEAYEIKINKKQEWIKKEKNLSLNPLNNHVVKKEILSNENSCIVAIGEEAENFSQALSIESNINSKVKLENNFKTKIDYSNYTTFNKKEEARKDNYDLDIRTQEDQDGSFFEVKKKKVEQRKRQSSPKMINYKNKKEREKLQGYRCEICQNVKFILNISFMKF
jgi:hypothetical protein